VSCLTKVKHSASRFVMHISVLYAVLFFVIVQITFLSSDTERLVTVITYTIKRNLFVIYCRLTVFVTKRISQDTLTVSRDEFS